MPPLANGSPVKNVVAQPVVLANAYNRPKCISALHVTYCLQDR